MNSERILIYTDLNFVRKKDTQTFFLLPILGNYLKNGNDPDADRFDHFISEFKNYFEFSDDKDKANFFLFPVGYSEDKQTIEDLSDFIVEADKYGKKVVLFYNSDDDKNINIKGTLLFRTSYNLSNAPSNVFSLPGWSLDFLNYYPNSLITYKNKQELPDVSYCGYADLSGFTISEKLWFLLNTNINFTPEKIRGEACRLLLKSKTVKSDFIIRDGFWASGIKDKFNARKVYSENMMQSAYALVARGAGNFSYRLFEVLSCGRIPVFINSDSPLPFPEIINWKKHMVWVELNDLKNIDSILSKFHKSKSNEEFIQLQKDNRNLYEKHLSPLGFFKTLPEYLFKYATK